MTKIIKNKEYSIKTMIEENSKNIQIIDSLFFNIQNLEIQSNILIDLLENASFLTLKDISLKCQNEIKKQNKGGK
nr:hypothetical protein [uncultured Mediterranean phage uvMED]